VYFAFDQADVTSQAYALRQHCLRFEKDLQDEKIRWFALVDGAFDHGRRPFTAPSTATAMYQADGNPTIAALVQLSPYFLAWPTPHDATFEKQSRQLLRHCNGRPMLSFIACNTDADSLCKQWQHCLMLSTQGDSNAYILRVADTRVTPALATLPNQILWQTLTAAIDQWLVIDRSGAWFQLPIARPKSATPTETSPKEALELSNEDLAHLLKCGQADSVINAIEDQLPELLPTQRHSQFYAQVAFACSLAERHGVTAFPDVVALAVASHLTQGEILKDVALLALLAEGRWVSGQLSDALIEFLPAETQ
jgi:Domain of unknown function (DUF4123)